MTKTYEKALTILKKNSLNNSSKENLILLLNTVKFLCFDCFMIFVFMTNNYYLLLGMAIISICIEVFIKVSIIDMIKYLLYVVPIILLSFIINLVALDFRYALLIMTRFSVACICTYTFSKMITAVEISRVITFLLSPLKILKVNVNSIGLMVSISISFIPIIRDEISELKYMLKAKGYRLKISNVSVVIRPLISSIFKRTNEIEKALIAKGYSE